MAAAATASAASDREAASTSIRFCSLVRSPGSMHGRGQAFARVRRTYYPLMNGKTGAIRAIFRGLARMQKTFTIEIGPLRASGVPAILLGSAGIVLAAGVTAALAKSAPRLPETLGEARGLVEAINARSPRLKA
jgi:hypothetical protein